MRIADHPFSMSHGPSLPEKRSPPDASPDLSRRELPLILGIRQEELFRRLVDSVKDYAIFMLTPEGTIASWNAGAERLKGYTAAEAIGRHFSMFYPAESIAAGWPQEELRRARQNGRIEDEGWRLRKDGTRFWANVVITPVWGAGEHLIGFSKVTRDLTERRLHETRLRESERNQRLLIEGVQDYAIFRLDPHGVITSWNLGAQRIEGYAAGEAIGCHFSIFYPPEAVARGWPQEELRRAEALGRFEDEGWRVRKDGTQLWANVVITAIRDERSTLLGFSKVVRDLSERRRQEQRLKESEENLRLVVEGVRDHALFLLGSDGSIASWNQGAERLFGWAAADIVGRPVATLYAEDDRSAGQPQAELASARHAGFFEADGWRARADGRRVWVHAAFTALTDARGEARGYVHILRDLSERLRVRELEDEGLRIQQFIAMLSHELRNPLAPISNAVRILRKKSDSPEVNRCADMIGRQAEHLTRLVEDLLDVSRITNGKIRIQPESLELNTLVKLAAESARADIEDQGHAFDVQLAPQSIFVEGDATRLTQVLANLLSNAAKYTPRGGTISVGLRRDHAVATLEVTDTGTGMSDALMQRAFDPFVQGSRELDRTGGGLGIGLTLVKKIVELHGGSVAVASAGRNRGTRFTVTLPLAVGAPVAAHTAPPPQELPRRRHILVVDDNRDAADSLAELLRMVGHDVVLAHDGAQALEVAAANHPDTVLLDIGLPGMDGYEVARRLRERPDLARARLIALTGYGQASDRQATTDAGFEAHLVKPVDFVELERLLA
jgi:PAS domain S-box-containing protein